MKERLGGIVCLIDGEHLDQDALQDRRGNAHKDIVFLSTMRSVLRREYVTVLLYMCEMILESCRMTIMTQINEIIQQRESKLREGVAAREIESARRSP